MNIKLHYLRVLGITVMSATLGAGNVYAESSSSGNGTGGASTMNAAGKTQAEP